MKNLSIIKKSVAFAASIAVICAGFAMFLQSDTNREKTVYAAEYRTDNADSPVVYMTTEITPESLVRIYETLGFEPEGNVAVKISTGEPPNSNYLRPELIKDLVQGVTGTIVECNTAYGGSRSSTALHKQVAADHGFTEIADVDIMDEDSSLEISVNAENATIHENYVGAHLKNYNSLICLAHFKGHAMAGYGGAIKNMSIGIASREGKNYIHTGGKSHTSWSGGNQNAFLESMGDATSAVVDFLDGKVVYINVMNRLSVDCDCSGNPSEPDMHDVGILASYDPVALDQACIDLIYAEKDGAGASLVNRIENRNGLHTLEHAEEIGLGSRNYRLMDIDAEQSTEKPNQNVKMSYENGELTISGLETDAVLLHASYSNETLTGTEILNAENGTKSINAEPGDKFFLWNSIASMYPLCPAVMVTENDETHNNVLIAYFSRAGENWQVGYIDRGNTAVIADYISEKINADVFEILPVVPYPEGYEDTKTIATRERNNNERPEFKGSIDNLDRYDTVFLGYPIWYGGMPMIMYTFLEEYDMSGKTVIPFSTHGGSGWGSSLNELKTLCPEAEFVTGFSIAGTNAKNARDEVGTWLSGLNIRSN
ncbi:MAG: DUF362 domain-containing protein [Oscillospiraceae bacterium]|nr:DUF362 domain-containing protein [Oscillospiraceae bacterium]